MSDSAKPAPSHQRTTSFQASSAGDSDLTDPFVNLTAVGPYEVVGSLGEGHFGRVLLAFDPRMQRQVAVKVLRSEMNSKEALESAFAEARAQAAVQHPHVVTVYEVGELDGGSCYVVSEYLSGGTLDQRMASGESWSPEAAVDVVVPLAEALEAAHRMGLVHRDVKPANVLFDDNDRPFLADFGLAVRELDQSAVRGQIAGTVRYMSPEQVAGRAHHLDGRTDIWALGVMLYALLTGQHPFSGKTTEETFEEIRNREPRPLRIRRSDLCPKLEAIVLRCLRKPVSERYGTAADLATELREWRDQPEVAETAVEGEVTLKKRTWIAPVVVVAALLIVALGIVFRPDQRPPAPLADDAPPQTNGKKQVDAKQSAELDVSKRATAVTLFALDAKLTLQGHFKPAKSVEDLPDGTFDVQQVSLYKVVLSEKHVRDLSAFPSIESIDFRGSRLDDNWLRHLLVLNSLRSLSLWDTGVTDEALRHVGAMKSLEKLVLAETRVTDDGLKHLLRLPDLRHLALGRTRVTGDGLRLLSGFNELEHVAVDGISLSEADLLELAHVKSLRSLHTGPLAADVRERLQAAMPRVHITTAGKSP